MTQSDPASVNVSHERVKILKQKRELAFNFYRFILIFFIFRKTSRLFKSDILHDINFSEAASLL